MTTYLIFGATGQVGSALNAALEGNVVALSRTEADFFKPETLPRIVADINPDVILNASAYTAVDKAEEEEALATIINGDAPGVLARIAAERKIAFVHYSTDYVFNGSGDKPWQEDDPVAPLNAYGRGKLAGEQAVEAEGRDYLIFRTSWVYDAWGKNFLKTMLRLGAERETLRVVADQYGAPSYAPHLAAATLAALQAARSMKIFPSGIYHMCNAGETTWHGFASAIFEEARTRRMKLAVKEVAPIPSDAYPTPAARPHNSRLDCSKLVDTFGIKLPSWQEGLKEALDTLA